MFGNVKPTSPALLCHAVVFWVTRFYNCIMLMNEGVCIIYLTRVSKAHDRVGCSKVVKYIAGPLQIIDIIDLTLDPVLKYK